MKKELFSLMAMFLMPFIFVSCGSNDELSEDINTADYAYFFSGKINGEPFFYGQKYNSLEDYEGSTSGSHGIQCAYSNDNGYFYQAGVYPWNDSNLPGISVEFWRMHLCSDGEQKDYFNDSFRVQNYLFANDRVDTDENSRKVGFEYYKKQEDQYGYNSYNGDQSTSYFEVTKSTNSNVESSDWNILKLYQTVEGDFSVKLYNENDPNDVLEITEGKFKVIIAPSFQ